VYGLGRMDVKQTYRKDLDPGVITVQHRLSGLDRRALDLLARSGVDRIDRASRHRAPERRENRTAHQRLRLGQIVGIGHRAIDPKLHGGSQVDEVAVAGNQRGILGRRLFLEQDTTRLLRRRTRPEGRTAVKLRARRRLPRKFRR
jgi:hypothetical protein